MRYYIPKPHNFSSGKQYFLVLEKYATNLNNKMIRCTTHLVECLRKIGIEPTANASSFQGNHGPECGLNYTIGSPYFFSYNYPDQWWEVDLKRNISSHSYIIRTANACSWVSKWNISVSYDDINWNYVSSVDSQYNGDIKYYFNGLINFRYLKIYGSAPNCEQKDFFAFQDIKIFGYLNSYNPEQIFTCTLSYKFNYITLTIFILL